METFDNSTEKLYTTGQFAKLCGVKKQTLFHYDDIGLLVPARKDPNGYRRYSHSQYQQYLLISCLKEAGMSLSEVKSYLELEDGATKQDLLEKHLAELEERIDYLRSVKEILQASFVNESTQMIDESRFNFELTEFAETRFWATERLDALDDKQLVELIASLVRSAEPVAVCLDAQDCMQGDFSNQKHLLISPDSVPSETRANKLALSRFMRPAGTYCVVSVAPGTDASEAYTELISYLTEHQLKPSGFFYEELPNSSKSHQESSSLMVKVEAK